MKVVGTRIKWKKYLGLFLFVALALIDIWLFYSLYHATIAEILLVTMAYLTLGALIVSFLFLILGFAKPSDVIKVTETEILISELKERRIGFKEIKDISYRCQNNTRLFGEYKSGSIIIITKDGKKVRVNEIKDVKSVCEGLRKIVFYNINGEKQSGFKNKKSAI